MFRPHVTGSEITGQPGASRQQPHPACVANPVYRKDPIHLPETVISLRLGPGEVIRKPLTDR
ncbi:MAG: hypothetical protein ACRYF4_12020 [Janthinobacterium lividum]